MRVSWFWIGILFLLTASCGRIPVGENPQLLKADFKDPESEMIFILEETLKQTALALNSRGFANSPRLASSVASACKTSWEFVWWGIQINFTDNSQCPLVGNIKVTFFPLTVALDIESTTLNFVKSIKASGNISFGGTANTGNISLQFLDGRIELRKFIQLPWQDLVLNAKMQSLWQSGVFTWKTRANAFESISTIGTAVMRKDLPDVPGWSVCMLTGGEPMNPDAGQLSACFGK